LKCFFRSPDRAKTSLPLDVLELANFRFGGVFRGGAGSKQAQTENTRLTQAPNVTRLKQRGPSIASIPRINNRVHNTSSLLALREAVSSNSSSSSFEETRLWVNCGIALFLWSSGRVLLALSFLLFSRSTIDNQSPT